METEFGPISANRLLELTDYEDMVYDPTNGQTTSKPIVDHTEQSLLTTFAKLFVYGPFFCIE